MATGTGGRGARGSFPSLLAPFFIYLFIIFIHAGPVVQILTSEEQALFGGS